MRKLNWPRRLNAVVEAYQNEPFVWGKTDCLCMAEDVVLAITGSSPAQPFRGSYDTRIGAAKVLLERGYDDLQDALEAHFPRVDPAWAQRGDLGLIYHNNERACVVCTGQLWFARTESGLVTVPTEEVSVAFHVE